LKLPCGFFHNIPPLNSSQPREEYFVSSSCERWITRTAYVQTSQTFLHCCVPGSAPNDR
jgi:hypothetical protein